MQAHQLNWITNFIRGIADRVRTGYEISFPRYFYKPQPMGSPEEIQADILAVNLPDESNTCEILTEDVEIPDNEMAGINECECNSETGE